MRADIMTAPTIQQPEDHRDPEEIDPADLAAVTEGLDQAKRRQFASPDRIAAALDQRKNDALIPDY